MKTLLEESDRKEVDRVRMLFEKNGIPIHIGNEATARNLNFMPLTKNYTIDICEDSQYECATHLLQDEDYIVKNPLDVQQYYEQIQANAPNVHHLFWVKIIFPALLILATIISFVALVDTIG